MSRADNPCPSCHGSGEVMEPKPCEECFGTGEGPEPDDPPEYDPYAAAADQAEDHAAAQAELAEIEAEEASRGDHR